ncbi:MAG: VOC family protein [Blastocatellia bacterium]|jgi:catechol 2,3-dioxygenase-like lactoylglutathione lyase family enzyme
MGKIGKWTVGIALVVGALTGMVGTIGSARGQDPPSPGTGISFHHIHLNSPDPKAAIDYHLARFEAERDHPAGLDEGIRGHRTWLLFRKVGSPPPWQLTSGIWHIGWGAPDMPAEVERQKALGTRFFEPLTDISDIGGNPNARPGSFYYAYVETPDRALIELNTAVSRRFGHLHLFSEDPLAAGAWYERHLGVRRRGRTPSPEPRFYRGFQIGPSVSLALGEVNLIVFPLAYARKAYADHWKGKTVVDSTEGRVIDHLGFRVDNLSAELSRLREAGVKITREAQAIPGTSLRHAFVEGPDRVRIELIEGLPKEGN